MRIAREPLHLKAFVLTCAALILLVLFKLRAFGRLGEWGEAAPSFFFGATFSFAWGAIRTRSPLVAFAWGAAVATFHESVQAMPAMAEFLGRTFDPIDLLASVLGPAIAVAILACLRGFR